MWVVIHIAANQTQAEMIKNMLISEGILANIRASGAAFLGDGMYEVTVPESEVEEAEQILIDLQII